MFLGLNGVVVKSHGGTDAKGFAHAIDVAVDMIRGDLAERINTDLVRAGAAEQMPPEAAVS